MEIELNNQAQLKIEAEILKVIDKCQELLSTFSNNAKKNIEIILLVGTTGAGKSTLFNFLSGANFKIQDRELQLSNPSNKFSEMKGGMHSVTKEPKYYFNPESNHLLIDFPGFQDTDGEVDQLLMELLFQRVVTIMPIKVVYVIKNNESTLPNRGIQILEFADQLFKDSNLSINKFNLLLNCYLEDLSDDELRKNIRRELTQANKSSFIDNILVIRKIQNAGDLNNYMTTEKRNQQWEKLQQIKSIQLKPKSIPKSEIISQYLRQQILGISDEYNGMISQKIEKLCNQIDNPKNQEQIQQTQSIIDLIIKEKTQDTSQWYSTFIQNCEKIPGDHQTTKNLSNFKKILQYCSQFSNQIEKYNDVTSSIQRTQMQFQSLQKNIQEKIQNQLEKLKLQSSVTNLQNQGDQLKQDLNEQKQNNRNLSQQMNTQVENNKQLQQQVSTQVENNKQLQQQMNRYEQNSKYLQYKLDAQDERNRKLEKKIQDKSYDVEKQIQEALKQDKSHKAQIQEKEQYFQFQKLFLEKQLKNQEEENQKQKREYSQRMATMQEQINGCVKKKIRRRR